MLTSTCDKGTAGGGGPPIIIPAGACIFYIILFGEQNFKQILFVINVQINL